MTKPNHKTESAGKTLVPVKTEIATRMQHLRASEIEEKINLAKGKLTELQSRHKLVAFDSVNGADIGNSLATVKAEIKATLAEIDDLTAAHSGAVEADERERLAQFEEQIKSQLRVCRSHLASRQKASEAFSAALEEAMKQWRLLLDHSYKARSAIVIGKWPNSESYVNFQSLYRLVERELYRLGGDGTLGNKGTFPGANAHDMSVINQPDKITPLPIMLNKASEYLIATLSDKQAE